MKLTNKSEYALLALIYLAREWESGNISAETIAKAQNIPPKFLSQILLILKRGHLVQSAKGNEGGYRLARDSSDISIAEVIRMIDGPIAPTESVSTYFYEKTPIEKEPRLVELFKDIRDYTAYKLEHTSLHDLI